MKYCIIICMIAIGRLGVNAQIDMVVGGAGFIPPAITVGGTATFNTFISINSTEPDLSGSLDPGCMEIILSLPINSMYVPVANPMGGFAASFTWTYLPAENAIFGYNNVELFDGDGGFISMNVLGVTSGSIPGQTNVNVSDFNSCTNSNQGTNDAANAGLMVNAPLPIKLLSFNAITDDCESITLSWETAVEINNSHFLILRSIDGKEFTAIGKVDGSNKQSITSYTFIDTDNLINGINYSYRLRQVDYNGRFEDFDIVENVFTCSISDGKEFKIFPNPTFDKLNIKLTGFEDKKTVELKIFNAIGEFVRTVIVNPLVQNSIDVSELNNGIYEIQTTDSGKTISRKFIVVD